MGSKRIILAMGIGLLVVSSAFAQNSSLNALQRGRQTTSRQILNNPTVSPYLRLLQGGGSGVNSGIGGVSAIYQTQVRPQIENRQQMAQQQQQIQQVQSQLNQVRNQYRQLSTGYMATGHPTRYMTYSHYYPSLSQ